MKQNTPGPFGQTELGNADKWELYRNSFLKLIEEEARLQIIAGVSPVEAAGRELALENAVIRVECARLVYNDSRDMLALALLRSVEAFESRPGPGVRIRCVARVAELLSECRGRGAGASADDRRTAERIVSAAHARFLEQQRA